MSIDKIKKGDALSQSADLISVNIAKLKELFPNVVTEGKIDFKVLQDILGDDIEEGEEYYRFTWAGKAQARREAHKPSTGTLRPCKDESVNWDSTENLYIEGDNLEVLKLLQKSYSGKVKMISIDPPYNTGKDFVYKDNYKDNLRNYQEQSGQIDTDGNKLTTNTESDGRYHSNWCNMMYPRLTLARNLLKDDGVIFMNIDDNEVENLKKISNEIFGEDCHLATFVWNTDGHTDNQLEVKVNHEYILAYKKVAKKSVLKAVIDPNTREGSNLWKGFAENSITKNGPKNPPTEVVLKKGFPCKKENLFLEKTNVGKEFFEDVKRIKHISREITKKYDCTYPIRINSISVKNGMLQNDCIVFSGWANNAKLSKFIESGFEPLVEEDGIITFYLSENGVIYYHKERESAKNILSVLKGFKTTEKMRSELEKQEIFFTYPKPNDLLQYLCEMSLCENEIMLDFFSGSASSVEALFGCSLVNEIKTKFIQIQLPEKTPVGSLAKEKGYNLITEIGKERIRRAGLKIVEEQTQALNKLKAKGSLLEEDKAEIAALQQRIEKLDIGFKVFKLDSSNIKEWDGSSENLEQSLFDSQDNIKTERTEEDVLYEILLKYGLDLTMPIEQKVIEGATVFNIGMGALFICLANGITNKIAEGIGAWHEELKPEHCRVVFKDTGFTDVEKTNSVQTLKRFGIHEIKSI